MKQLVTSLLLITYAIHAKAQVIELFGFERQVQTVASCNEGKWIAGYGSDFVVHEGKRRLGRTLIIWDAMTGKPIRTTDLTQLETIDIEGANCRGILGKAKFSPNGDKLIIIGTQYQGKGTSVASVLHSVDLQNGLIESRVIDRANRITDLFFHPSDSSEMVFIFQNGQYKSAIGTYRFPESQSIRQIKSYNDPVIPLSAAYSDDGKRLYVATGTSSGKGTLEVFLTEQNKLVKQIPLREHVSYIFTNQQTVYLVGTAGTFPLSESNLSIGAPINLLFSGIDNENSLVLLNPMRLDEMKKLRIRAATGGKEQVYPISHNCVSFHFANNQRIILAIVERESQSNANSTTNTPSILILNQPVN